MGKFKIGDRVRTEHGITGVIVENTDWDLNDSYRVSLDPQFIEDEFVIAKSALYNENLIELDKRWYRDKKINKLV